MNATPFLALLQRRLFGAPIPQGAAEEQKLPGLLALPILASDALSSVAYATEAALGVLVLAGSAALGLSLPITAAIALLIVIVVFSYRQTIEAYPQGGGAYVVARENLGTTTSLVAAASLLIDYVPAAAQVDAAKLVAGAACSGAAAAEVPEASLAAVNFPGKACYLLSAVGLCASSSEARRQIQGGGVKPDGEKLVDPNQEFAGPKAFAGKVLQLGKKTFRRLVVG